MDLPIGDGGFGVRLRATGRGGSENARRTTHTRWSSRTRRSADDYVTRSDRRAGCGTGPRRVEENIPAWIIIARLLTTTIVISN